MEDLDDINTEEGLWRMEEYFAYHHRYSKACLSHLKQHQDFYRYLSTHTRSGSFYTPVAFLHGRFDGWKLFGAKNSTWGRLDCPYTDAENAWDMLDAFYPHSKTGAIYRHGCPKDRPIGHYSGTPSGSIDVIPIEAKGYSEYPLLCSIGYNKALDEDMDKLSAYVNGGGTLFIGLPQLSVTTDSASVIAREAFELMVEKHRFSLPLRSVTVTAIELVEASDPCQLSFFSDWDDAIRRERLDRTVDTINNRYGLGTVCYAGGRLSGLYGKAFGFGATQRADVYASRK